MAAMGNNDRVAAMQTLMEAASRERRQIPLQKPDLRAALNAVDDWVVANAASYNAALPAAARNGLSAAQKAELLAVVVRRRFEVGA